MNTGTLVGSLIMAAVVAVLITFLIRQMMRGWLRRGDLCLVMGAGDIDELARRLVAR